MTHPLPAFTVMEFTVAMVITAITTATGYQAVELFTRQSVHVHTSDDEHNDLITMAYLLQRDIVECDRISRAGEQLECTSLVKTTLWNFEDQLTIRTTEAAADTFAFALHSIETALVGIPTTEGYFDHVTLNLRGHKTTYPLTLFKSYSTMDRMAMEKEEHEP